MDFQLQQMYSCEVVGKGVCIAAMSKGRNYSYNIIQSSSHKRQDTLTCTFADTNLNRYKIGKTAEI